MSTEQPSPEPRRDLTDVPPEVSFRDLSQGAKEVIIEYDGKRYRLIETKNHKLILNR